MTAQGKVNGSYGIIVLAVAADMSQGLTIEKGFTLHNNPADANDKRKSLWLLWKTDPMGRRSGDDTKIYSQKEALTEQLLLRKQTLMLRVSLWSPIFEHRILLTWSQIISNGVQRRTLNLDWTFKTRCGTWRVIMERPDEHCGMLYEWKRPR